jgi:hypothetical protein
MVAWTKLAQGARKAIQNLLTDVKPTISGEATNRPMFSVMCVVTDFAGRYGKARSESSPRGGGPQSSSEQVAFRKLRLWSLDLDSSDVGCFRIGAPFQTAL